MSDTNRDAYYAGLPRRRVGAGVLFVDDAGRPLLVEPTYKPNWEVPGGVVEAGENPRTCAYREVREELGIDVPIGRLLLLDHKSEPPPRGDSTMLIYEGGILHDPAVIRVSETELRSFRFVPEEELEQLVSERFAYRVRQAVRAFREGITVEIVDGRAV